MITDRLRPLKKLVRLFTYVVYGGVVVIVVGITLGALIGGASGAGWIAASCAGGAAMVFVGLRERKHGKEWISRVQRQLEDQGK